MTTTPPPSWETEFRTMIFSYFWQQMEPEQVQRLIDFIRTLLAEERKKIKPCPLSTCKDCREAERYFR